MKKINKAVLLLNYPKEDKNRVIEALDANEVCDLSIRDGQKIWDEIEGADVVFLSYPLTGLDQKNISTLKWLHADMAGLDLIYTPKLAAKEDLVVTAGNGRSSHALAEHALMFMLNLAYGFSTVYDAQQNNDWIINHPENSTTLAGKTLAIFGTGNVGTEVAKRGKAFGMNVVGYVRDEEKFREPYSTFYRGTKGMNDILGVADFIVITLPLSNETWHTFTKREFDMMKDSVYIINMSRGPIIDEKQLITELNNNRIRGFAADSFEMEPLAKSSPLWQMKNVYITPHITPAQPGKQQYMTDLVIENIKAYKNNEPLKNTMKPFLAYDGPSRYNFDLASKLVQKYSEREDK